MRVTWSFRPLPVWPHETTTSRKHAQFKSARGDEWRRTRVPLGDTLTLLEREVDMLRGSEILIGIGLEPRDIRQDGRPRADARAPSHPGVEVSFDSQYGRLTYATDVFTTWEDNLRAIALGLEALRKVDRYGVAKRGQQYAGFAMLTAGPGREERGRQLVEKHGSIPAALRATHPDTGEPGYTTEDFMAVQAYRNNQYVGVD